MAMRRVVKWTSAGVFIGDGSVNEIKFSSAGAQVGTSTTASKLGFYGATPVVRPSGAGQAALTATSTDGTAAAAAADLAALAAEAEKIGDDVRAAIVFCNKVRTDLVALGLWKGSA